MTRSAIISSIAAFGLSGRAGMQFFDQPTVGGLTFFEPIPVAVVKVNPDCVISVEVSSMPGPKRSVRFKSGLGSADLSLKMTNGVLTEVGSKTDTKIPETISAAAQLATAVKGLMSTAGDGKVVTTCKPDGAIYQINTVADGNITLVPVPFDLKIEHKETILPSSKN